MLLLSLAHASSVLYLNADGAHLEAGPEDAARNTSSVLRSQGVASFDVPPHRPGEQAWRETVDCVQRHLADFDVEVVTTRPSSGPYPMIVVGGEAGNLKSHAGGLAPSTPVPLRSGVGFAFASEKKTPFPMCQTIVHEYGHVMGLDHSFSGDDVMGGGTVFQNHASACGRAERRACKNGQPTQNSWQRMVDALGLAPGARIQTPRVPPPFHEPHAGSCRGNSPKVRVTTPHEGWLITLDLGQPLDFKVTATDPDGIHEVHMAVASTREPGIYPDDDSLEGVELAYDLTFPCSEKKHGTLTCAVEGGASRFQGKLAPGRYRLHFVADDTLGHRHSFVRHLLVRGRNGR